MNILITLCGRAGSKGCHNKNIRNFDGFPLIYYTLATALLFQEKRCNDKVDICVDSDSDELLELCKNIKNIILSKRPKEFAQDQSPKMDAIRNALTYAETLTSDIYDAIVDLDITSPLRKVEDIEEALNKQVELSKDVVFSVVPSRRNPYFNMIEVSNDVIKRVFDGTFTTRQAAPRVYDMNASIYCYDRKFLLNNENQSPLNGEFDITFMPDTHVIDIDTEDDFICLEILWKQYFRRNYSEIVESVMEIK